MKKKTLHTKLRCYLPWIEDLERARWWQSDAQRGHATILWVFRVGDEPAHKAPKYENANQHLTTKNGLKQCFIPWFYNKTPAKKPSNVAKVGQKCQVIMILGGRYYKKSRIAWFISNTPITMHILTWSTQKYEGQPWRLKTNTNLTLRCLFNSLAWNRQMNETWTWPWTISQRTLIIQKR